MSAPSSTRTKEEGRAISSQGAAGSKASAGVSTLDKSPSPPSLPVDRGEGPDHLGGGWSNSGFGEWGATDSGFGASTAGAAKSSEGWASVGASSNLSFEDTPMPTAPMPSAQGWAGGGQVSGTDTWGGIPPASSPPPQVPATSSQGGWLGGEEESPTFKVYDPEKDNGWGESPSSEKSSPQGGRLGAAPVAESDHWGSGSPSSSPTSRWGSQSDRGLSDQDTAKVSTGWLGDDSGSSTPNASFSGSSTHDQGAPSKAWMGSNEEMAAPSPSGGRGWLNGEDEDSAPTMTEMVDRAMGAEAGGDFIDDSWVDEEVEGDDFDELGAPEYIPPTMGGSGSFIKVLLATVFVLMIGAGVFFMGQDHQSPEEIQAEKMARQLGFAQTSLKNGQDFLAKNQPELAIGPLKVAFDGFKALGGHEEELYQTKRTLALAQTKAKKYDEAFQQWSELTKGPEKHRAEAKKEAARVENLLLAQADSMLVEAGKFANNGESASVLDLGRRALSIYEKHGGKASQKGRANGVIGRGYVNGDEYGKAKESFKIAQKLNPAGNYAADLAQIAQATAPVDFYAGTSSYGRGVEEAPAAPQVVHVEASLGDGPDYAKGQRGSRPSHRRSSSVGGGSASADTAAPAKKREAPAFVRSSSNSSSKRRLGDQGVLKTY